MGVIGRIIGLSLLGGIVLPLALLIVLAGIYVSDARCGTPADSGGCEVGMAMTVLASAPVGAAFGLMLGIWKSVRRKR